MAIPILLKLKSRKRTNAFVGIDEPRTRRAGLGSKLRERIQIQTALESLATVAEKRCTFLE